MTAPAASSRAVLIAASAAVALAAADTYVVVLALPDMMSGVGLGVEAINRATPIVSGFLLGYIAMLPFIGRLADLVDRRAVLLAMLAVFVAGSTVTALATDLPVLVAGRFVQGVGGGGLVPATLALVADLYPAERRGVPLGMVGAVQELGAVLGPVLGALVLRVWDWRGIFWLNALVGMGLYAIVRLVGPRGVGLEARGSAEGGLPGRPGPVLARLARPGRVLGGLGAALLALALWAPRALTDSVTWGGPFVPWGGGRSGARLATPIGAVAVGLLLAAGIAAAIRGRALLRRADPVGAVLVAVALGALVLTFATADPEREVLGPLGATLLPVGALAVAAAAWRNARVGTARLLPPGTLRGRAGGAVLCSFFVGAALVTVVIDVPLLARLTVTTSMTDAALVLVRFLVAVPLGALAGGVLLRRFPPGPVAAAGLSLAAGGIAAMAHWDRQALAYPIPTTAALLTAGLGIGLSLAPVNAAGLAAVSTHARGAVSAWIVVARMVGMVVGLALLTAIGLRRYYEVAASLTDPTPAQLLDAVVIQVQTVFAGGAVCAGLAALAAWTLGSRRAADPDSTG